MTDVPPAPRGVRLNNPGNLRHSTDDWLGLSRVQTDTSFCQFASPIYGIRALCMTLMNYQAKYKLYTIKGIIGRWAPPNENDTSNYAGYVAKAAGVEVDTAINLHQPTMLHAVVCAIIRMECENYAYSDDIMSQAMAMADVALPGA